MTVFHVPYTKIPFGNKQFVIQWELNVPSDDDVSVGDTFEAVDCELISLNAFASNGSIRAEMLATNLTASGDIIGNGLNVNISGNVLLPLPERFYTAVPAPALMPTTRFYAPNAQIAAGTAQIALLFRAL